MRDAIVMLIIPTQPAEERCRSVTLASANLGSRWRLVFLLTLTLLAVETPFAKAQPGPKPSPSGTKKASDAKSKTSTEKTGSGKAATTTAEVNKVDSEKLPEGFKPPAEKSELADLDKPLMLPEELDKLKKELGKNQRSLVKGELTDADKVAIRAYIRYKLGVMCQHDEVKNLPKLKSDLLRDINQSGATFSGKLDAFKAFRAWVMQELTNQAAELFDNNLYLRIEIALLLGELDLTEANANKGTTQQPFDGSNALLIKIITDPNQPEAVKIPALMGLHRMLRLGTPPAVPIRLNIANAVIGELSNTKAHWWYQMRLTQCLGLIDIQLDAAKQPFVVNALVKVLNDKNREWVVRAEAARALGRVPLPPACVPQSVVAAIGAFALELSKAAQQNPANPNWKNVFMKVYLAFVPENATEMDAGRSSKAGLRNNAAVAGVSMSLYTVILPMVNSVINGVKLTPAQIQSLTQWLATNAPQNGDTEKNAGP